MLRCMIFTCTWCYAAWSSLALDATLHDLHLHLMLRCMIFTCTWCYAAWSSLALDAALHDLHLHTWCHAAWSSLALDATLHDLHLHLMLRCMFRCSKMQRPRSWKKWIFWPSKLQKNAGVFAFCRQIWRKKRVEWTNNHPIFSGSCAIEWSWCLLKSFKNTGKTHRKRREKCWLLKRSYRWTDMFSSNMIKISGKRQRETQHVDSWHFAHVDRQIAENTTDLIFLNRN